MISTLILSVLHKLVLFPFKQHEVKLFHKIFCFIQHLTLYSCIFDKNASFLHYFTIHFYMHYCIFSDYPEIRSKTVMLLYSHTYTFTY